MTSERPRGEESKLSGSAAASQLAAIVTSSEDPIIGLSLDRRVTSWNAAAARLFGYEEAEILGQPLAILVPDDRREEFERIHGSVGEGGGTGAFETIRRRKDGSLVDVSVSVSPVFDSDGRVIGSAAIDRDISRRKAAERELERQRSLLRLIVDALPVLISYVDREGRYRLVNARYEEWFGAQRNEMEGQTVLDVLGEEAWRSVGPRVRRALEGETVRYEQMLTYRTGGARHVHAEYVPDRAPDGSVRGMVALVQDVTERKEVEAKLAEADRRKDEFLAMLAHELRNPMGPMVTGAALLREQGADPELRTKVLDAMDRQMQQLQRLVDDLLDVSRISRGKIRLERQTMDARRTVRDIERDLVRSRAELEGKEVVVELPAEPVWLDADPVRLAQMVGNLATNALKYTEPGGHIWISLAVEGAMAVFRVRDDGVGIDEALMPSIFDLFTQGDVPLSRDAGGLGIGLTTVSALAELHGGEVRAESPGRGEGATFELALPVVAGPPAAPEPTTESSGDLPRRRVLVVEDDVSAAELLALLLRRWGQEVWVAHTGERALTMAREHEPDLILLDIGLPGMDGYEVVRELRAQESARASIAMLSGYGQVTDKERSEEAGADHHLTKPADPEALRALLREER